MRMTTVSSALYLTVGVGMAALTIGAEGPHGRIVPGAFAVLIVVACVQSIRGVPAGTRTLTAAVLAAPSVGVGLYPAAAGLITVLIVGGRPVWGEEPRRITLRRVVSLVLYTAGAALAWPTMLVIPLIPLSMVLTLWRGDRVVQSAVSFFGLVAAWYSLGHLGAASGLMTLVAAAASVPVRFEKRRARSRTRGTLT